MFGNSLRIPEFDFTVDFRQAASKLMRLDPPLRIAKFDADEAKVILNLLEATFLSLMQPMAHMVRRALISVH
jgi:hypothetical protein